MCCMQTPIQAHTHTDEQINNPVWCAHPTRECMIENAFDFALGNAVPRWEDRCGTISSTISQPLSYSRVLIRCEIRCVRVRVFPFWGFEFCNSGGFQCCHIGYVIIMFGCARSLHQVSQHRRLSGCSDYSMRIYFWYTSMNVERSFIKPLLQAYKTPEWFRSTAQNERTQ